MEGRVSDGGKGWMDGWRDGGREGGAGGGQKCVAGPLQEAGGGDARRPGRGGFGHHQAYSGEVLLLVGG
eukprot:302644-Pyramimonas_sp.AAC.1